MEVFAFKDGMPEVIWCEASPRCRIAPWLLLKRSRRKKLDSSDERGL